MPTDPADPSSPKPSTNLYQTTSEAPRGGGGIFFVILLLLLLGGGAAYYFLIYKPGAVALAANPALAATPVPSATPAVTAKATPAGNPTYSGAQRTQYIRDAEKIYSAQADPKRQAFTESFQALMTAGGFSAVGLTSKDAIAARRNLVAQCQKANDDYEDFVKVQEQTYKDALQKTPLVPNDVDVVFDDYKFKAQTEKTVQLRDMERESLKTGDELLGYLDKNYGSWSVNAQQHLTFKPGVSAAFNAIGKKYNDQATAMVNLQNEIKAIVDPNATPPGASPAGSAAASPATAPAPSVAP